MVYSMNILSYDGILINLHAQHSKMTFYWVMKWAQGMLIMPLNLFPINANYCYLCYSNHS
jgi:hypothetical protein